MGQNGVSSKCQLKQGEQSRGERHVLNMQLHQIPSVFFSFLFIYILGGWLDFIVCEQHGHNSSQLLPVAMTTGYLLK